MPQFYALGFAEALSYDPKTQNGGPKNLFHFSHFSKMGANKKLKVG